MYRPEVQYIFLCKKPHYIANIAIMLEQDVYSGAMLYARYHVMKGDDGEPLCKLAHPGSVQLMRTVPFPKWTPSGVLRVFIFLEVSEPLTGRVFYTTGERVSD